MLREEEEGKGREGLTACFERLNGEIPCSGLGLRMLLILMMGGTLETSSETERKPMLGQASCGRGRREGKVPFCSRGKS